MRIRLLTAHKSWIFIVAMMLVLLGCAHGPSAAPRLGQPIGVQLMRTESMFVGAPFRVLLDFESDDDRAFIAGCPSAHLDQALAHTGKSSLQLPPAAGHFSVRLPRLLDQGPFPGSWTLLGGYFWSQQPATIGISYEVDGQTVLQRTVNLPPGNWTPVMLDIVALNDPNRSAEAPIGMLRFTLPRQTIWCDDLLVMDNTHFLVGDADRAGDNWTVCQRGFATIVDRPGSFKLSIPTVETGPAGWQVEESNPLRIVLASSDHQHIWTIYRDGDEYLDGKFKSAVALSAAQTAQMVQQQDHPAELSIPEELGRVERNSPGDLNNDGYAELTGAYQVKASGARIQITIAPQTPKLAKPVVEIAGLPLGRIVAALDGQLIDQTVRLANGHVLVQIPSTIQRPVNLDVRVQ
jgi:hypothetical protein